MGPARPLWNTELPDLYGFVAACESHEINVNSHKFFNDWTWPRSFKDNPIFEISPPFAVNEKDIFIYPFTLACRLDFRSYFSFEHGILEYGHTPENIKHHVIHNNGFFLLDLREEAFIVDIQLDALHAYFKQHNIPLNKIIYLTGAINCEEIYSDYCERRNIGLHFTERIKLISQPDFALFYEQLINPLNSGIIEPEYDVSTVPEKLFLCWNRRYRYHRLNLAVALDKAGLVDRSFISIPESDSTSGNIKFKDFLVQQINPSLSITASDIDSFCNKLPLILDGETFINAMCADYEFKTRPYYRDSLVSIVTETNYDTEVVTATEKSFKPMREKHPFILVGAPGSLKVLRDYGFKTFSDFWDESYDETEDHSYRMVRIIFLCKEIASWDQAKILEFKEKVKPIVEHNFNMLKNKPEDITSSKLCEYVYAHSK